MEEDNGQLDPAFPWMWHDYQPTTGEQVVREQGFGLTKRGYFAVHAPTNEVEFFIPETTEKAAHWLGMKDAKEYLENNGWQKAWIKARRMWTDALLAELNKKGEEW
jgi:hypothetical protein